MQIKNVTIGTDPELFLRDSITKEFIPATGLIGGTKQEPKVIKKNENGNFAIQEDNVMVEFNVPYSTLDNPKKLSKDIRYVLDYIEKKVNKIGLESAILASAYFDWKHLDTEQARTFGCDPDFNAWTEDVNHIGKVETNLRTSGGHVHIGYDNPEIEVSVDLIKILDLYLGVPSIVMDKDTERRKLYGKSGCFRFTEFGCEYRVLSNFWIASDNSVAWIFEQVRMAIDAYNNGFRIDAKSDLGEKIQKCINTASKELARELIDTYIKVKEVEKV